MQKHSLHTSMNFLLEFDNRDSDTDHKQNTFTTNTKYI